MNAAKTNQLIFHKKEKNGHSFSSLELSRRETSKQCQLYFLSFKYDICAQSVKRQLSLCK